MPRNGLRLLLLLAVAAGVFLVNLGATRLWDVDEAIFASAAQEMMQRGDLIVPYFNGQVFSHKPILTYWVMILNCNLWGQSEFSIRLGSALAGLACVLLVYDLGRRLFDRRVGWWAGLILASNLNFAIIARAGTPDALLCLFCTLAIWIFVCTTKNDWRNEWSEAADRTPHESRYAPSWTGWAMIYAAMGLGALTKGPVAVVLPTSVIGLFLLFAARPIAGDAESAAGAGAWRRWASAFSPGNIGKTIWSMRPLTAVLTVLAVAGPWYLAVGWQTQWQWTAEFFGVHNFGRFLSPMESHRGPFFYYLAAIAIFFFPWSVLLAPAGIYFFRSVKQRSPGQGAYLLLATWLVVWIGFFSLASTKLPSYVVPAYPALALAAAAFVGHWISQPQAIARGWLRAAWVNLLLVALGLAALAPVSVAVDGLGWAKIPHSVVQGLVGAKPVLIALGAVMAACAVAGWVLVERRRAAAALVLGGCAPVFVMGLLAIAVLPVDAEQSSRQFVETIRENARGKRPTMAQFGYFRPSLVYYSQSELQTCDSLDQVRVFFQTNQEDAFLLLMEDQYRSIEKQLPADVDVLERRERFLKPGKVLLLGRAGNVARWPDSGGPSQAQRAAQRVN